MRKFVALTLTVMFVLFGVSTANAWVTRASSTKTSTTNFGTHLSSADNTVQKALDTLDDIAAGGDVTGSGDCAAGACGDGSADGGTYYRLYDGNSNYSELQGPDVSGDTVFTMPGYTMALPTAEGTSGWFLKTNANGTTQWAVASGSGTVTTVEVGDVQVGGADIIIVDFNASAFDVTNVSTEINISVDFAPSSGNATLVLTEDAMQVKYDTTDFGETSDGLVLGASPTIATALLMGSDPAEAGTIRMPLAGSIVFEDGTEGAITHVNDYGFSFNVDLEAADGNTDFIIRSDDEADDTIQLQAMNVGGSYTSFVTLTSHATLPTLTLASTGASTYISSGSTVTIESVVFTGAAVSGVSTLGTTDDITIVAGDPDLVFTDSTHSAQGKIMMDSVDEHDGVMVLAVDDGAADDNPYIEIDGANDRIEMKLALLCDTTAEFDGIAAFDANPKIYDGSHYLTFDADGLTSAATIKFGGDTNNLLIANGTAAIDIAAGATLDLDKNLTVDGQGLTLTGGGQANIVTFNEAFTVGDGNAGTLTFTGATKTLSVEGTSVVDQDLTTDAGPRFETIEIGAATDTTLARGAAGAMTVEGDYIILSGDTITGDVGVTFDVDGSSAATIADSVAVASWTLTTPSVTNGITITGADAAPNAASEFLYDNVVAGLDDGAFAYYNSDGDTVYTVAAYVVVPGDAQDDYVLSYDKDSDRLYFKLDADAGGNPEYQNIADPTADGSISFGNDEEAVYTSAQAAAANDVFSFIATGAFGDISIVKIDQNTGDATDGTMLEIATDDVNVDHLLLQFGASDYVTHKIIDVGSYTMDITSDGTPKFVFADEVSLTKVPAASAAMDVLTLSGTLAALDADDFTAILIDYDTTAEHLTSGEIIMLEIDTMDGDAQIDSYGIKIGNMENQAKVELAIAVGTGWDAGISFADATANIAHSGNTSLSIISASGTVIVESVTFTGAAVSGVSTLGTTDDITIVAADPDIVLDDSDGADGLIQIAATDAVDAIMTFAVDDSGGDDQAYIECDGVAEAVDILQKMTVTGISHLGDGGASHYVAVSATGAMTFVGNAELILSTSDADPDTTAEIRHDTTITDILDGGALRWFDGGGGGLGVRVIVDLDTDPADDNYVVAYDADADKFYMMTGASATAWDDLSVPDANESLDHTVYYTEWDFGDDNHDMLSIYGTAAFGNYSIVRIEQKTGDATDGDVLSLQTADANVDHLVLGFGADEYVTHKIVDAGTYTMDITSNATAEFVFADETTITAVNAAASSMDALTLSGTTGNFDGADIFRGLYLNYVTGTHAGDTNNQVGIDFAALTGDADTNLYAIRIGALTGTAGSTEVEHAISIGTGWDAGINFTDDTAILNHSGATSLAITSASGTVIIDGATTFTGANVTSMGTLGVGAVTSTGLIMSNASAPALATSDTDGADGTGSLTFASTGAYDIVGTINADINNSATAFIEVDGVTTTIDLLQNIVITNDKTLTFDESDGNPDDADVVISGSDGLLTFASLNGSQGDQQAITIDLDQTDDSIIIGATNATIVDFGTEQVAAGSFDASEGNISNVGIVQADEVEPDAVANGSLIVQGGQTNANTLKLQGYDVDGTAYTDVITITSANLVTMALSTSDWNIDATGAITGVAFDVDGTGNTLTNIVDANIKAAAAIDATKIGGGAVSTAEFDFLSTVSSDIQVQMDANAPDDAKYILQTADGELANAQALSALSSGLMYVTTSTGAITTASEAQLETLMGLGFGASKVATSGYILVADGTDFESVIMSADATIAAGGAVTVVDDSHAHVYSNIDATTSANWIGRVSDETGTGKWCFATAPTFTTSIAFTAVSDTIAGIQNQNLVDKSAAEAISGAWEIQDDTTFGLGNDANWLVQYDETGGADQLLLTTTGTSATATTDPMFQILVDFGTGTGSGMTANQQVFGVGKGTQASNVDLFYVDEDGDVYIAGDIITQASTDPSIVFDETTGSDTDWWAGINADQEGDDDDNFEIGVGTTPGTTAKWTLDPSGNSESIGTSTATSFILEGGTYDTTIDGGTPTESVTYQWPLADGTSGQAITTNASGVMSWTTLTATAHGSDTYIQWKGSGGALTSEAAFTYEDTANTLNITAAASNPTITTGDGTYSWGHTPQVGIEGVLEVDGNIYGDAGIVLGAGAAVAGEIGFDTTNSFSFFGANSEDLEINVGTAANKCTITSNTSVDSLDIQIATLLTDTVEIDTLLDVDEEIDIDFDNEDEEISIVQAEDGANSINDVVTISATGTSVTGGTLLQLTQADLNVANLELAGLDTRIIFDETDAEDQDWWIILNADQGASADDDLTFGIGATPLAANSTKLLIEGTAGTGTVTIYADDAAYGTFTQTGGAGFAIAATSDGTDIITIGDSGDLVYLADGDIKIAADGSIDFLTEAAATFTTTAGGFIFDADDPAASAGQTYVTISGTLPIADNSDTYKGLFIDLDTTADHTGSTNVQVALDIDAMDGDAQIDSYGIRVGNMANQAATERAIQIGTGWDAGIHFADTTAIITSGGTLTIEAMTIDGGAVSNVTTLAMGGTLTGVTTATLTHSAPAIIMDDSDSAAGTGSVTFASTGAYDVVGTIDVDIGGTATTYMTIDGAAQQIAMSPTAFAADTAWADAVKITGTFANHTTGTLEETFLFLDPTLGAPTGGTLTLNILEIDAVTSDEQYTTVNAFKIGALSSAGSGAESAIIVGSGWDIVLAANAALLSEAELEILDGATLSTTQINYLASAGGTTGTTSTNVVFSTSPTLVTPTLGVAGATSVTVAGADTAALFVIDETDGADWWIGADDTGDSLELRNSVTIGSSVMLEITETGDLTIAGDVITVAAATDPYVFLNETDGTDLYIGLNDSGNIIEFRTSATNDTLMLLGLTEAGALVFEGDTDDGFETTLAVVEPTADATITAPDYTGGIPIIIAQGYTQLVHSEASTVDITGGGVTLADGWFTEGKTLKFVVGGTLTGANDTMSVILYLEDGAVMTLTTADGAAGDWVAEFTVVAESATAQRIIGTLFAEGGVETICDYATDATDTGAVGTIPVKLQFALANATDSITSEYVQIWHWNKAD